LEPRQPQAQFRNEWNIEISERAKFLKLEQVKSQNLEMRRISK
jgi:hypothetical protein